MSHLPKFVPNPNLLVGFNTSDDAGVYKLTDEIALVQTVDFFTPVVDDPYLFGKIAAVNSLSDVWAMGGEPLTALAIVGLPLGDAELDVFGEVVRGGAEMLASVGVTLVGGHTVEDRELKFGYAITGLIHPQKVVTNSGAKAGDRLILTKSLGTGIISSAIKFGKASEEAMQKAVSAMTEPNRLASQAMQEVGVNSATDITGFGLLGHAYEMAKGSKVTLKLNASNISIMPQVFELLAENIKTKGDRYNRTYVGDTVEFSSDISALMQSVLFDPQTAGGLLISVAKEKAAILLDKIKSHAIEANIIGEVQEYDGKLIRIIN
ncbi:MAG: selenide, water dikinase SelD [Acidobacteria bacterium]|nr:selenide, water dikinase SelD [Acidobacteriota bacterium]